jgi:hypothetical protein
LTGLVKKIEQRAEPAAAKMPNGRNPGIFIITDSNDNGLEKQLRALAEKESLKRVSLCIGAPPEAYDVSKDADITVVVYQRGMVVANYALLKGELDDDRADAIVKSISEVLPK